MAFDLTDRGEVTSISVSAFQAGQTKPDVAERMASAAVAALQRVCNPHTPCKQTMSLSSDRQAS